MVGKSTLFLVYGIIYLSVGIAAIILWQFTIHVIWDGIYISFAIVMFGCAFLSFFMYHGRGVTFLDKEMIVRNFKKTRIKYSEIECVDVYLKEKKYGRSNAYDFRIVTTDGKVVYITEFGETRFILEGFKSRFASKIIMHDYSIMFVKPRRTGK